MEAKLDIKTKFAIGSAVVAFLAGWGQYVTGGKVGTWYDYINSQDANPDYIN